MIRQVIGFFFVEIVLRRFQACSVCVSTLFDQLCEFGIVLLFDLSLFGAVISLDFVKRYQSVLLRLGVSPISGCLNGCNDCRDVVDILGRRRSHEVVCFAVVGDICDDISGLTLANVILGGCLVPSKQFHSRGALNGIFGSDITAGHNIYGTKLDFHAFKVLRSNCSS